MQVVSPPIYLTGYIEFQDVLAKNLSEAYVGQLPASDVLKRTTDEWNGIVNRIGRAQAQGGAGELQGGDAQEGQAGRVVRRSSHASPDCGSASELAGLRPRPGKMTAMTVRRRPLGVERGRSVPHSRPPASIAHARDPALPLVDPRAADRCCSRWC